jgi:hypothetical protein
MNPTQTPIDTPGQRYCPTESPRVIRERAISCVRLISKPFRFDKENR